MPCTDSSTLLQVNVLTGHWYYFVIYIYDYKCEQYGLDNFWLFLEMN